MKLKSFNALGKYLSTELHDFVLRGSLLYIPHVHHVLRGVCFEPSRLEPHSIYATFFAQPLCVPSDCMYITVGHRLRSTSGDDLWAIDNPGVASELLAAIRSDALPYLTRTATLEGFAQEAYTFSLASIRIVEDIAYAHAYTGATTPAADLLHKLLDMVDMAIPWQSNVAVRARRLLTLLPTPDAAKHQLQEWEKFTLEHLRLPLS